MAEHLLHRGEQRLFVNVRGEEGPGLLFAHGLFGTHADASWISERAYGFTVIAPDLRGRGASRPAAKVEDHAFDAHAADILAILDRLDISRAVIAGSSFGAAVAVAFALRHLERVRALILISNAFGALHEQMGEGDLESYRSLADRIAAEGLAAVAASESERLGSSRPMTRWTQHDEDSLVAWLRAVPMFRPFERSADLQTVTVPTLVVSGGDAIHTRELSKAYADALPNATLVEAETLDDAVSKFLGGNR
ncbi:MAG: alpha/beta hydrolase [Actinobacteria bacterium]|nr:alpha/beta hydrolase [Actinomycetota bacterium]